MGNMNECLSVTIVARSNPKTIEQVESLAFSGPPCFQDGH